MLWPTMAPMAKGSRLIRLSEGALQNERVIILVHGIFSNHDQCFSGLVDNLRELGAESIFDLWAFDYDYARPFADNADDLAAEINDRPFQAATVDLVGHSMGGLVARMTVLRHSLPMVRRIVTLATPNHGTVNGTQLNLIAQMTLAATRRLHPLYARAPGIVGLTSAHKIMKEAIQSNLARDPTRLDGKSYVSIPAQYYHSKRQLGDPPPSLTMSGVTLFFRLANWITKQQLVRMTPVHDGIVEERSNQLSPAPTGSTSEASYFGTRDEQRTRVLHVTHEAAADHDHVTVASCAEIADLVLAVLAADALTEGEIDAHLDGPCGRVHLRPIVT